jgi:hypothetical protein
MIPDPVAEIKRIRHELGAAMDFDIHRIFDDLRRQQATSGRNYVRHPARRVADNKTMGPSGRSGPSQMDDQSAATG